MKKNKNPLNWFFSLAPKDPKRKADYDYYLFWILFLAFLLIAIDNVVRYFKYHILTNLGWAVIMFIIAYFNYYTLKAMHDTREMMKTVKKVEEVKPESPEEMFKKFNDTK